MFRAENMSFNSYDITKENLIYFSVVLLTGAENVGTEKIKARLFRD